MKKTILTFTIYITTFTLTFAQETGCFSGNCINGEGTFFYTNGDKYEGNWKDGKRYGEGTFYTKSGRKIVGYWKDDNSNGFTTIYKSDGSKIYEGNIKDGKKMAKELFIQKAEGKLLVTGKTMK
ncbi:MORN repeat-containing protein [Tenacibaculum aestuarii]|uniref:hypothetical protein n=1 Tax=Tenacibaculum aestuarii TaxID=362781 RepID=UPI00389677C0